MQKKSIFHYIKPSVPKYWLYAVAGLLWTFAGAMLFFKSETIWLCCIKYNNAVIILGEGVFTAFCINHFIFHKIVNKNLKRILKYQNKVCLFAFISWKSYFLILTMIFSGYLLKSSSFPKQYLFFLYICMGAVLIISSFRYYLFFINSLKK